MERIVSKSLTNSKRRVRKQSPFSLSLVARFIYPVGGNKMDTKKKSPFVHPPAHQQSQSQSQSAMATIQYTFKGQRHEANLEATASTHDLLESISTQTSLPVTGLKVSYKGKALKVDHETPDDTSEHLLIKYPGINAPNVRLFVLGTTEYDIAKVHTIDNHVQTRKNYRPPPAAKVCGQCFAPKGKMFLAYNSNICNILNLACLACHLF